MTTPCFEQKRFFSLAYILFKVSLNNYLKSYNTEYSRHSLVKLNYSTEQNEIECSWYDNPLYNNSFSYKLDNDKNNSYFKDIKKDTLKLHIAHNEGNYFCTEDQIKEIDDNNQIALSYSDDEGNITEKNNPNGSIKNIAGIFNKDKNILGMMPHPERMIDPSLSGEDGSIFFKNLINNLK